LGNLLISGFNRFLNDLLARQVSAEDSTVEIYVSPATVLGLINLRKYAVSAARVNIRYIFNY
jgi:hypothetical protein